MKALSRLSFVGFSVGALAAGFAAPAHATLQFTVGFIGSEATFTCVDNSACDSNPVEGAINIASLSLDGVIGTDIDAQSSGNQDFPGTPALSFSVGSLFNGSGEDLSGRFALSDTDFRGPPGKFETSANVAWTNAGNSTLDLAAFLDTNNAQGGNTPTDASGSQIGAFSFAAPDGDQIRNEPGVAMGSGGYSLSDQGTLFLVAGGTVSGGQSTTVSGAVPELSTWAMMAVGFAGLGFAGLRRTRRRLAAI